jgi:hypothetical protein
LGRLPREFIGYSSDQIQRAEARKKREQNLKKKHIFAIFMNFDPDQFDINENMEKVWTKNIIKTRWKSNMK